MTLEMKYFVLKPKAKSKDDRYAIASQQAMLTYADKIFDDDPFLATELRAWVAHEEEKQVWLE
jgi:hypothetical protein